MNSMLTKQQLCTSFSNFEVGYMYMVLDVHVCMYICMYLIMMIASFRERSLSVCLSKVGGHEMIISILIDHPHGQLSPPP